MLKRVLLIFLGLSLWTIRAAADEPVESLETFIATHRAEIFKLDRDEAISKYFATTCWAPNAKPKRHIKSRCRRPNQPIANWFPLWKKCR